MSPHYGITIFATDSSARKLSRRNAHRFGVEPQVAGLNLQHDSLVMDKLADNISNAR